MKKIVINNDLKMKVIDFHIGVLSFQTSNEQNPNLDPLLKELEEDIQTRYKLEDVLSIENIKAGRDGYKALGKDPSRYRLAVESLYRRIVKGHPLYRVNTLVDLGNILSLKTMRSIAVLDEQKIKGDILIRIGQNEAYEGIGRGPLNIENIPVYCDEVGPFGSPTSDTLRTSIDDHTAQVLLFIISFNGMKHLQDDLEVAKDLYKTYAKASNFSEIII